MAEENYKRTEINELGEFGLIERITRDFKSKNPSTLLSVGDDAAVVEHRGKVTVVTTDLLTEGIHFDISYVPLKHLGYKSVIVNLSDIYAMNAIPEQITFSMGLSSRFSVEAIEEIYTGIKLACDKYNVDLIGGDTSASRLGLMISVTAIGAVEKNDLVKRSGARAGDLICISGDVGGAYLGLLLLEREKQVYLQDPEMQPELEEKSYILERQLKPEARNEIIRFFRDRKIKPTAMIDVSDGISSDIIHICRQSEKGCYIYEKELPIHKETYDMAVRFNHDPTTCAMNGGEDYELMFTVAPEHKELIDGHPDISIIGVITENKHQYQLITKSGTKAEITAQGWNAFKKDNE